MTTYKYHLEDGQFSIDFTKDYLLGNEGEVVSANTERSDGPEEIYILYIDGDYVECIGNVERTFPKNKEDHENLKSFMKGST